MNRFVVHIFSFLLVAFSCVDSAQGATQAALEGDAADQMAQIKDLLERMSDADRDELSRIMQQAQAMQHSAAAIEDSEVAGINQGRPEPGSAAFMLQEQPQNLHDAARLGDIDAAWNFLSQGPYLGGAHYADRDSLGRTCIEVAALYGNDAFVEHYLSDLEDHMLPQLESVARRYTNEDLDPYYTSRDAVSSLKKFLFAEKTKIEFMKKRRA